MDVHECYQCKAFNRFTVNMRVNLTDKLIVRVNNVKDRNGDNFLDNATLDHNVTLNISVLYINGSTAITNLELRLAESTYCVMV